GLPATDRRVERLVDHGARLGEDGKCLRVVAERRTKRLAQPVHLVAGIALGQKQLHASLLAHAVGEPPVWAARPRRPSCGRGTKGRVAVSRRGLRYPPYPTAGASP